MTTAMVTIMATTGMTITATAIMAMPITAIRTTMGTSLTAMTGRLTATKPPSIIIAERKAPTAPINKREC